MSFTAMATWSISVSNMCMGSALVAAEQGDLRQQLLAHLGVRDAKTLFGRKSEYPEFSFVQVVVDLVGRVTGLLQHEDARERRLDPALADQSVRLPGLAVIGEVAALQRLEIHPEVPVVVLDRVSRGRGARDDEAAPLGDEHRRAHGLSTRVLEDDVGGGTGQLAALL